MTRRPSTLALLREAQQMGMQIRIIHTHAGDMIVESLTGDGADACVPGHAPTPADAAATSATSATITAFERRIAHAQRRAS